MSGFKGAEERYMTARNSTDMTVNPDGPCDADKMLAAAFSVSGNQRRALALRVYSCLADSNMRGANDVAHEMAGWLVRKSMESRDLARVNHIQAVDISLMLLKLWHKRVCQECHGRGHPLIQGTPVCDESRQCPACHGTGQIPIERLFRTEHVPLARLMEGQINSLCSVIFKEMAIRLRGGMDL